MTWCSLCNDKKDMLGPIMGCAHCMRYMCHKHAVHIPPTAIKGLGSKSWTICTKCKAQKDARDAEPNKTEEYLL